MVTALVVIVILVVVGLYAVQSGVGLSKHTYASVTLSGSATVVQQGNTPSSLLFTDESGKTFTATIANNYYTIVLPTNHTYSVQFKWTGSQSLIAGFAGQCAEGAVTIPSSSGSPTMSRNYSC